MCYSIELLCSYGNDRRQVIDVNSVKIEFKQLTITSTDETDCGLDILK